MKYLFIIFFIFCAVSVATLVIFWPEKQSDTSDTVVTINGRVLTRQAIQQYKGGDVRHGQPDDLLQEMITKQLLIAEAQRLQIDQEPSFRAELKSFYEHSLIKIMMERIEKDIEIEVSEHEVERYLQSFGKTFTFYTMTTQGQMKADTIKAKGEKHTESFDNLSSALQNTLSSLQPGESSVSFVTGNEKLGIYLEKIEGENIPLENIDKNFIKQELLQSKVEAEINNWIDELRKQASITYNPSQE